MSGILTHVVAALVVLGLGAGAQEDGWGRFRGPNGGGVSAATGLPAEFSPGKDGSGSKGLAWKAPVPFGRSSPVIAGDQIFLTASEDDRLIVFSLDRATGRERWRREIARPRVTPIFKHNDPAAPTPATDGRNVYAFFLDFGLISFDGDGQERWRLPLGPFNTFYGLGASPILHGDMVIQLCDTRTDAFLIAVDSRNGSIRWRADRSRLVTLEGYASPAVWTPLGKSAQVLVLGSGRLDSYDAVTGDRLWSHTGLASLPIASPVVATDVVVVSTYGADRAPGPSFDDWLKFDANGDGRLSAAEAKYEEFGAVDRNNDGFVDRSEWDELRNMALGDFGTVAIRLGPRGTAPTPLVWRNRKVHAFVPSPLVYQGALYAVESGGVISSLDPGTGKPLHVGRSPEALGEYYASPVAADGKVYFTSEAGKVTVVRAGRPWKIVAVNDLGDDCYATPAIAAGHLYFRTRSWVYAFGSNR